MNVDSDSFGSALRQKVDQVAGLLTRNYGQADHLNRLYPGSIWDEPRDWMMGVRQGERFYMYTWNPDKDNIQEINLSTKAMSSNSGYFLVEYIMKNFDAVNEENNATSGASL